MFDIEWMLLYLKHRFSNRKTRCSTNLRERIEKNFHCFFASKIPRQTVQSAVTDPSLPTKGKPSSSELCPVAPARCMHSFVRSAEHKTYGTRSAVRREWKPSPANAQNKAVRGLFVVIPPSARRTFDRSLTTHPPKKKQKKDTAYHSSAGRLSAPAQ